MQLNQDDEDELDLFLVIPFLPLDAVGKNRGPVPAGTPVSKRETSAFATSIASNTESGPLEGKLALCRCIVRNSFYNAFCAEGGIDICLLKNHSL